MRNLVIGFVAGILSFLIFSDIVRIASDHVEDGSIINKARYVVMDAGTGLWFPLSGRCTKELRRGKHVMREYFGCNSFQNKISYKR